MAESRRPDFRLKAMTRQGVTPERKGTIGAGWQNDDGSIAIKLDPFVQISGADNLVIMLFPADQDD